MTVGSGLGGPYFSNILFLYARQIRMFSPHSHAKYEQIGRARSDTLEMNGFPVCDKLEYISTNPRFTSFNLLKHRLLV